jgi:DNA-binding GntR family transcriptional regulator
LPENLVVPSVVDVLYEAVRARILTGELTGGTPLTEKEVATSYDVARPTAKAALERLIYDGLLRRTTNKTARVASMSADDIADLYYTRGFLEREVMRALAGRRVVAAGARSAMREMHQAIKNRSLSSLVEADVAFHCALVDSLGSPRLTQVYLSVMGETQLCMAQIQSPQLLHVGVIERQHQRLLKAIEAGDSSAAADEITEQLKIGCDELLSNLRRLVCENAGA